MKIELFDYSLPQSFIAQKPLKNRDNSKLLILNRHQDGISHDIFSNLGDYLREGDVLVINESRVRKCRLFGIKENTGASIECFVLKKIMDNDYQVLLRPSKRLKPGDRVSIGKYYFEVISKQGHGKAVIRFSASADIIFEEFGEMPLPPYIRGRDFKDSRYQTIYAADEGSAAAPTAGLHFTEELMDSLKDKGIAIARLQLNIGLDTFRPISVGSIEDHRMHREYYYIRGTQAEIINRAKQSGGRVIAVGTTTVRVLETLMQKYGKIKQFSGYTGIYIYPPFRFRIVDSIITNFHLPRSTLLVMVSAFAGRKELLHAYEEAKENNYRFYSFGDCMLIK
ncbi:MAG TPA: tRNA preQ1(34) S-adenosylmethionine ribosyltransferase-isomerase QueA [Actinobacteria bacterium]|nr:tRNA preQ1(34) S-adenosylmethionine ribosyltransferase-isomerase QueA [Actinomycetota bacterium]